jgi:hypothetical protein
MSEAFKLDLDLEILNNEIDPSLREVAGDQ